ncbi:uncharacterized protein EV420DRAFT_1485585 [Desarmillaria tabescens]|uniref:Uncharacterized protein n=1 Tax=Armillaria tabescens TaxID=1929756 RepID=A0AA39MPJ5_ARMTA|nr:uncharacterized protein EV420DRAFT_1485585 [Desarmillaria tabescens]KAK0441513.1 hypothetical protein EV420DRAFT_1485585 [Desarmillaria tabescens]
MVSFFYLRPSSRSNYSKNEHREWQRNMEHTFLDLEAIVDDEDQEDDESDEDIEDFIDDSDLPDEMLTTAKPAHEGGGDEFDAMMEDIANRWISTRSKAQKTDECRLNVDYQLGSNPSNIR